VTWVDLHSHVLPGIDDGPPDTDGALALARAARDDGVAVLAATPHVRVDHPDVVPSELADRVAALQTALDGAGIAVEIVQGGEVDLFWAADADEAALRAVSYGGRGSDLLVETPYGSLPPVFEEGLFRLTALGYRVLLAHPERSPALRSDAARLEALVRRGVLVQVTAAALVQRSPARRFATALVRERLAHVIASDAHGAQTVDRAGLGDGVAAAARIDRGLADWMVTEAPAAILAGRPLPAPPAPRPRRGPLRRLLGR
jgi:protein-tyrosine phosphatase